MDVVLFGTYFWSGVCSAANVQLYVNGFAVGGQSSMAYPRAYNGSVVTQPCARYGCDGQWPLTMYKSTSNLPTHPPHNLHVLNRGQLYQNGVPGYSYGGSNTLTFQGKCYIPLYHSFEPQGKLFTVYFCSNRLVKHQHGFRSTVPLLLPPTKPLKMFFVLLK